VRLAGKVALVTGGASGIGAATCRLFAGEGIRGLLVTDIQEEAGRAVAASLDPDGQRVAFRRLDVTQEADWAAAVGDAVERFGALHVLVNNAGRGGVHSRPVVELTTEEGWDVIMAANAKSVLLGMKHAIPALRAAGGGSIVNVVSVYSIVASTGGTSYHASKGAARMLTRSAAVQYAREGIRVNAVHPGFVETGMTREFHAQPGVRQERIQLTPLGRLAEPEDIAPGILFLASDDARYVTGAELVMDGGLTAR
jgi:cyclopentanol dehydrogenase